MYKLVAVGKIKEKFFTDAIKEYEKRIKGFTPFQIIEVKEVNIKSPNENRIEEGHNILKVINEHDYVITLEILGKMMDSVKLSKYLQDLKLHGQSSIVFVIGGSTGLSEEVKARSNLALSFSEMTFPHQLMRVIAAEQIYRSLTIEHHQEYHK